MSSTVKLSVLAATFYSALCCGSLAASPLPDAPQPASAEQLRRLQDGVIAGRLGSSLLAELGARGRARVMLAYRLDLPRGASAASEAGREAVARGAEALLARLSSGDFALARRFETVNALAGEITAGGLLSVLEAPGLLRADLDVGGAGNLAEAVPLTKIDQVRNLGYTGAGVTVAVLDTGIDRDHPDLSNDLAAEACFCRKGADGSPCCPNGQNTQTGAGSAEDDHGHGTNVSGIITSDGVVSGSPQGGAPSAKIVAVKVLDSTNSFFSTSEIVAGLDWVIANHPEVKVVNMSLGTGALFPGTCDGATAFTMALATPIDTLRTNGALVFVSAGNNADSAQMSAPACIANAIAVGAVYDSAVGNWGFGLPQGGQCNEFSAVADKVACFSNSDSATDIFAPGVFTATSKLGGGTSVSDSPPGLAGTSQASPLVAACAADLLSAQPTATPAEVESALKASTTIITDSRNGLSFPRLDCKQSLDALTAANAPTQIAANAGDNQTATAGTAVAIPPSVIVRNAGNQPVAGVAVTFAVASGGGSVTGASATTNASGIAQVGSWTLGAAGTNTLTATSAGLSGSPVTFTATAVAAGAVTVDSFTLSPAIVAGPGTTTLSWSTTGASSVTISGVSGTFGPSGSTTVSFTATTTYTLTATGTSGSATASVTIVVLPASGQSLGFPAVITPTSSQSIGVTGVTFSWNAVTAGDGYDLRIWNGTTGTTMFTGSLQGSGSTSTLIGLPAGLYLFGVRACSGGFLDATCDSFATVDFTISPAAPAGAPTISAPAASAVLASSTQTLSWTSVSKAEPGQALFYEVLLEDLEHGSTTLQIRVPDPSTSTIFSLPSSTSYRMRVRACQAGCGPYSTAVSFSVSLPATPSTAPTVTGKTLSGSNLTLDWTLVSGADLYQVQVVQPGAGPGGGALTVAAQQVSAPPVTLAVPSGTATIVVQACNADGCGPASAPTGIDATAPNPSTPILGTPLKGSVVAGPIVNFSWSRIPGDTGSNVTYRLFVQDLSRQATALDVYTTDNFYAAYFKAEGARYDALVIANPTSATPVTGPASGFNVAGTSATAPTMVQPAHQSPVTAGNVQLGWSPVAGATLYEYYVAVQGVSAPTVRGVTPGLVVQVPLSPSGQATVYSGIVRACPAGATCVSGSDAGWGPWSNQAGPGVTNFTITATGLSTTPAVAGVSFPASIVGDGVKNPGSVAFADVDGDITTARFAVLADQSGNFTPFTITPSVTGQVTGSIGFNIFCTASTPFSVTLGVTLEDAAAHQSAQVPFSFTCTVP